MDGHDQREDGYGPRVTRRRGGGRLSPSGREQQWRDHRLAIGGFVLLSDDLKCVALADLLRARDHQMLEMLEAVLVCDCGAECQRVSVGL
ncbi:hypothetical protein [Streptomyces sp900116325]|uniref:hypothetical protein n=1 Tax=Streptomyces sp. 900116325 TaxID=3154295 RepID=UPI003334943C